LHGVILHLDKINKKFDLVLSNGVIHHMKDPAAGCEALLKRLKKNGLIKLSLYSETTRSEFLKFQDEAKLQNLQSRELLRDFRNAIIRNNDIKEKWMTTISDFYNLREFKDLICHEQEHTFTIKKIQILIEKFNLEFCGFQNNFNLHEKFKDYFNSSQNLYNLDYWQEFEEKNPHIFKSMYQFWCQKNY
jgi:SAM-dependent methyltransferase